MTQIWLRITTNRCITRNTCDRRQNTGTGEAGCGNIATGYYCSPVDESQNTPLQGAHINVVSGNFIIAQPLGVDDGVDYCHSGRIRRIDEDAIHRQLDSGAIVLMGPVAVSVTGESFNLTSEEIATQLAIKLKAEKMIGFCSSQGVTNDDGDIVSELFPNEAQARVEAQEEKGDYNSGTVRFLRGAVKACRSGVRRCHLISYQEDGALLQELFSRDGIGTQIVMESAEQIRRATINDIGGILELIRPLEQQGILVRRSREQLEMEIDKFTIIQRDNTHVLPAPRSIRSRKRRLGKWPVWQFTRITAVHHGRGSAGTHYRSGEAERLKQIVCADHAQYSLVPGTWIYPGGY